MLHLLCLTSNQPVEVFIDLVDVLLPSLLTVSQIAAGVALGLVGPFLNGREL